MFLCAIIVMNQVQFISAAELLLDASVTAEDIMESDGSAPSTRETVSCQSRIDVYNSYSQVFAKSNADGGMERIYTWCAAYYESGALIGQNERDLRASAVMRNWVEVAVPDSPFPLKAYSAISTHIYERSGFNTVEHHLSWRRDS